MPLREGATAPCIQEAEEEARLVTDDSIITMMMKGTSCTRTMACTGSTTQKEIATTDGGHLQRTEATTTAMAFRAFARGTFTGIQEEATGNTLRGGAAPLCGLTARGTRAQGFVVTATLPLEFPAEARTATARMTTEINEQCVAFVHHSIVPLCLFTLLSL